MSHLAFPSITSAGILLLFFGIGQLQQGSSDSVSQPAALTQQGAAQAQSPDSHSSPDAQQPAKKCVDLDDCMKQIEAQTRTIRKEVEAQIPDLERTAEEMVMTSPELSRLSGLSAKLQAQRHQLASRASQLSAEAEALTQQVPKDVQENVQKAVQEDVQQSWQDAQEDTDRIFTVSPNVFVSSTQEGGWLGVEIGEVTAEKAKDLKLAGARGVVVEGIEPDSPAAKAGIKEKDVVTQYDGQTVEGTVQFRRLVRETPPGRTITLEISRGGATQTISVELGDRSDVNIRKMKGKMRDFGGAYSFSVPNIEELPDMPEVMDWRTPVLGINAEDLTGQLGSYFGAPNNSGVLVREVRVGSPADKAGLKAGDVIVKIEGKQIRTLAELRAQLREKSDESSVNMAVIRKGSEISVAVPIEKPRPTEQMQSVNQAHL